jgi:nitroimidazol reductase NimA-like FMN-containing flavoprotein (pyridoxamine 5'-phosphate oxidase superfamily)
VSVGATPRTRVHRLPERAVTDEQALHDILDAGVVAHVSVVTDGQPYVVPVGYARRGGDVVFHGSSASRLFRTLSTGQPMCFTVTLLDGLVLARSAFNSSMNYRSVMVLGAPRLLTGDEELAALEAVSEHLIPGQWQHIRHPSAQELKATTTLALSLDECSIKVRTGEPHDDAEDVTALSHVWAGVVPIRESFGEPIPAPDCADGIDVPSHVRQWVR